ncbi:MAG: AsnC family transcriptional regulator [Firmicutes bacterium HGW-Firmicutes-14]|jgi:DNA-binding IscR family transcriptional regulator|nr:MAG: AsnC family transcriptional regulator [Firmicutes bacterium HGW-Firmicutes-14]
MAQVLTTIHHEIIRVLRENSASYVNPVTSDIIGNALNVTPSYIREQMTPLQKMDMVGVRRGPGGGYFLAGKQALKL